MLSTSEPASYNSLESRQTNCSTSTLPVWCVVDIYLLSVYMSSPRRPLEDYLLVPALVVPAK